jgi:hypothetical protein
MRTVLDCSYLDPDRQKPTVVLQVCCVEDPLFFGKQAKVNAVIKGMPRDIDNHIPIGTWRRC